MHFLVSLFNAWLQIHGNALLGLGQDMGIISRQDILRILQELYWVWDTWFVRPRGYVLATKHWVHRYDSDLGEGRAEILSPTNYEKLN